MKALALIGDWNAGPREAGRWSPAWLAARAGLTVVSAGPGRHGDIDYALVRGCVPASRAVRDEPPAGPTRSDHDVVLVELRERGGGRSLRVGSWNVRFGRPPQMTAAQVSRVLIEHRLDVLVLQEAADYHRELRLIPGYLCVAFDKPGQAHQVIMVRYGNRIAHPQSIRTSPRGWQLVTGGRHRPLYVTSVLVADWLRVVDVHQPPSVSWRRGVPHGPPMRVGAYVLAIRRLARLARTR